MNDDRPTRPRQSIRTATDPGDREHTPVFPAWTRESGFGWWNERGGRQEGAMSVAALDRIRRLMAGDES